MNGLTIALIVVGSIFGFALWVFIIIIIIKAINGGVNFFHKQNKSADANIEQAKELKRANDLKERELKLREEELKRKK